MKRWTTALLVALGVLAAPGAAQAGTYRVVACGDAGVNRSWELSSLPPGTEGSAACDADPEMPGAWVRDIIASPVDMRDGEGVWLRFDALPGTSIAGITYERRLWKVALEELHPELRTGEGQVLETCEIAKGQDRCSLTGRPTFGGLSTSRLEVGVRCEKIDFGTYCPGGGTRHGFGAQLVSAEVVVRDDVAPSSPAVGSSGLWSGAGWYRGSSSVTVSGSDVSGVQAVRVFADSRLVVEQPVRCDWTARRPCPAVADLTVPVDTRLLGEGRVSVGVALVDAAGNVSTRATRTVLVANEPPAAPVVAIDRDRSSDPSFVVSWAPSREPAVPIARAHVRVCDRAGCSTSTTTAPTLALRARTTGETTVTVWLEDVTGNVSAANAASYTWEPPAPATPLVTVTPARSTSPNFVVSWTPAVEPVVPLARAHVEVCWRASCTTTSTTSRSIALRAPGAGTSIVSVWLEDVDGRADRPRAAIATFTYDPPPAPVPGQPEPDAGQAPPPNPPAPSPAPAADPAGPPTPATAGASRSTTPATAASGATPARSPARLRLTARATRAHVRVTGRLARTATGRLVVTARWRTSRGWSAPRTTRARIQAGTAKLTLHRPPTATSVRLEARYTGNQHVRPARASRTLRLR